MILDDVFVWQRDAKLTGLNITSRGTNDRSPRTGTAVTSTGAPLRTTISAW